MTDHEQLIEDLLKPGGEILDTMTATQANLIHLALGLAGEAGELVDAIKKSAIYGKPLDMENVMEELGDLEFYAGGLRQACGYTRDQVLDYNIAKLRKRYGDSYSNKAAIERADKKTVMEAAMEQRGTPFCVLCGETGHGSAQCQTPSEFKPSRKQGVEA